MGKTHRQRFWRRTWLILLLGCGLMTMMSYLSGHRPDNLGVRNGKLAACPDSPNCVSTQAPQDSQRMEPLRFTISPDDAWQRLQQIIAALPRTRLITQTDDYLHYEFRSFVFRFVDDVEFVLDRENRLIHFRSASRVGHNDLGANRQRMKTIQSRFAE